MASLQTQTTSFKAECWQAVHNLLTDTIKLALYTNVASMDQSTTVYTTTGEVVAAGYTAGGNTLTSPTIGTDSFTAFADFADTLFTGAITARYALIYNASKSNKSIAVLDFGSDKTSLTAFPVTLPPNTATTALLRSSN
jgi:hypothetical protein